MTITNEDLQRDIQRIQGTVDGIRADVTDLRADVTVSIERSVRAKEDIDNLWRTSRDHGEKIAGMKSQTAGLASLMSIAMTALIEAGMSIFGFHRGG